MFRELSRKKQQLSQAECIAILEEEKRGILSVLGEDGYPYGAPLNHFYNAEDGALYFHCGNEEGHRLDALRKENKVSFCVHTQGERMEGHWAFIIKSVVIFGKIEIIEDMEQIIEMTTRLSHKFTQDDAYIQKEIENHAHRTLLLRLRPEHICGKRVIEA